MKTIELDDRDIERLRVAAAGMQELELRRAGERMAIGDKDGELRAKVAHGAYQDLWSRLYRLQYNAEPRPMTDAASCTG